MADGEGEGDEVLDVGLRRADIMSSAKVGAAGALDTDS